MAGAISVLLALMLLFNLYLYYTVTLAMVWLALRAWSDFRQAAKLSSHDRPVSR